ncbi:MAG: AAA family ATPase [Kofleriaceae bacterium]
MLGFPPFQLDLDAEQLWKGTKQVPLRRKPFAILRFLAEHPARLVTHDELLAHVWGGAIVSDSAVRTHVHELRQALGEGVIETVVGRGYRFVATVSELASAPAAIEPGPERLVVGRDAELATLRAALARAVAGTRQICFVTGDPGIGKTTLVERFLDEVDHLVLRGANVEQHGTPEAYGAVIDMLARTGSRTDRVVDALVRHAPTFLAQIPHLIPEARRADVERRAAAGNEARMVRELMEAIEAMCGQEPAVVVFEDLQWSDVATLDLLALLGQRRERANLLVIATSRRDAAQTVGHPLNRVLRQLVTRTGALAIALDAIGLADVERFLALRFPDHSLPPELAGAIAHITGGTPLFMTSVLDDLVNRGFVVEREGHWVLAVSLADIKAHRPDSITQLIDMQLDRLEPTEQRVLEAAAVIGAEFSTELVAVALALAAEAIDEICDSLVRRSLFLRREGTAESATGEPHTRYGVTHALVQQVCVERGLASRRQRWHRAIAEHLEASYGSRVAEVAQMLAVQFDGGQVLEKAVEYYLLAGERAASRFASTDATVLYRSALGVLARLPASRARTSSSYACSAGWHRRCCGPPSRRAASPSRCSSAWSSSGAAATSRASSCCCRTSRCATACSRTCARRSRSSRSSPRSRRPARCRRTTSSCISASAHCGTTGSASSRRRTRSWCRCSRRASRSASGSPLASSDRPS